MLASGLYNNAGEVVREALRLMKTNHQLLYHIKFNYIRAKYAEGERNLEAGRYTEFAQKEMKGDFSEKNNKALNRINREI